MSIMYPIALITKGMGTITGMAVARVFTALHNRLGVDHPVSDLLEAPTIAQGVCALASRAKKFISAKSTAPSAIQLNAATLLSVPATKPRQPTPPARGGAPRSMVS